ncbi:disease resistance protein TAO1-like [Vigna radiata var. radiata]|uniref:ADP-ribosyl cyclase/cyclic ADP-ribose hydrolase n=1 Tax=Vigna radiata var. radiata TaxID=3916 RepID=A0A1S3U1N2_VIGRR|nr:disease resistance protein TAO1-like [Vigna radiata var. radiata]
MAESSSSLAVPTSPTKYDVFLSFRGEDTRYNFISHLYDALHRNRIKAYRDDRLQRGEEISPALQTAIEESKIYVLVFSENYASSTWCLNELTKILNCKKIYERDVIPVFYKVDPSTVRKQEERYKAAFEEYEQRFKDDMDKVQGWKDALTEAAGLSGWDSNVIWSENILVEEIVKDIVKKLDLYSSSYDQGIIGIEKHIERIRFLMHFESSDIRIIGICDMGGIGKTTISEQIYHTLGMQFDSRSLVLDTKRKIERDGIDIVRKKYMSEYSERLKRMRILIILDDVTDSVQLKQLLGRHDSFGQGSRIIITSRDRQVLKNVGADDIYDVKELNDLDSLKLFSLHAFKQNSSQEITYKDLTEKVLRYAKGIPLVLQTLGSLLYGRTREAWESQLQKLEKCQHLEIFNVLKLSYDGLDEEEKNIFLDIACFYRGDEESEVVERLDECGFSSKIGMDVLKDRCLISIFDGRIVMHDLLQEMGQEIVRKECPEYPGKRSRLFKDEEIHEVLKKNKGSDAIQCILLGTWEIKKDVIVDGQAFQKMDNLRMLMLSDYLSYEPQSESRVFLASSLVTLPDTLKILYWKGFPQRSLPPNFCPENLVRLEMPHCHLEQLWEEDQSLPKLKRLDLSWSSKLTRIQDLSMSPNIEEIILNYCRKLIKVHSSILLTKLSYLSLDECHNLKSVIIPSNILTKSPGLILLSRCGELEMFSTTQTQIYYSPPSSSLIGPHVKLRRQRRNSFNELQSFASLPSRFYSNEIFSITFDRYWGTDEEKEVTNDEMPIQLTGGVSLNLSLKKLCLIDLSHCSSLTTFPFVLSEMKFLKKLFLSGCSKLENFPEIEDTMENLAILSLNNTSIKALPSSLGRLVGLQELNLYGCRNLEIIPSSIGRLTRLCKLHLTNCHSLQTFPNTIFKLKLRKLDLYRCLRLRTFPKITEQAQTFSYIDLSETAIKELPSSFDNLVSLRSLQLNKCRNLESLPNSIVNLKHLCKLDCSGCHKLTEIPRHIGRLTSLMELLLNDSGIVNLPESIAHLSSLKSLDLSDCKRLECIPQIPSCLKQLVALDCPSIRQVMSNRNLSGSKEGVFKFHFTNAQQLDSGARANIEEDARLRMTDYAYRSVFFCYPGTAIPHWFPFRGKGCSVTINEDLSFCSDDRLIGFALCVAFGLFDSNDINGRRGSFRYRLKFECDDYGTQIIPNNDLFQNYFKWNGKNRFVNQDHTFMWKFNLESLRRSCMNLRLCDACRFTFEIIRYYGEMVREFRSVVTIKECGLCPLYRSGSNVGESSMETKEDSKRKAESYL